MPKDFRIVLPPGGGVVNVQLITPKAWQEMGDIIFDGLRGNGPFIPFPDEVAQTITAIFLRAGLVGEVIGQNAETGQTETRNLEGEPLSGLR